MVLMGVDKFLIGFSKFLDQAIHAGNMKSLTL